MFINFGFILIILSQTEKTRSVFVSVGDYSNESIPGLNTPECGLSALPIVYELSFEKSYENNCFRNTYKNKTLVFFDIHNTPEKKPVIGRIHGGIEVTDATQTPWVVYIGSKRGFILIKGYCTGVLVTFEWILTAAHCYEDIKADPNWIPEIIGFTSLTISMGSNKMGGIKRRAIYENAKFISHDLFVNPRIPGIKEELNETRKAFVKQVNDIALIKIPDIGKHMRHDDRYLINTICLPKRNEVNERSRDAATFYGYGRWNDNWFFGEVPDYLHMGTVYLDTYRRCSRPPHIPWMPEFSGFLCGHAALHIAKICAGDSGGPLVQFVGSGHEKRAILVGTLSGADPRSQDCVREKTQYWVPTSKHIDWILKTMKNN